MRKQRRKTYLATKFCLQHPTQICLAGLKYDQNNCCILIQPCNLIIRHFLKDFHHQVGKQDNIKLTWEYLGKIQFDIDFVDKENLFACILKNSAVNFLSTLCNKIYFSECLTILTNCTQPNLMNLLKQFLDQILKEITRRMPECEGLI